MSVTYTAVAGATTNVVFDVTGFFVQGTAGAMYVPVTPNRLLDTRVKNGLSAALKANKGVAFHVTGRVPSDLTKNVPTGAVAVTGTLTVVRQTAAGYLSLTKTATNTATTSTLNFPYGDIRATGVTVPLGPGGILGILYFAQKSTSTTDAVFDVTGYFVQ
jgi:hypothetical protein